MLINVNIQKDGVMKKVFLKIVWYNLMLIQMILLYFMFIIVPERVTSSNHWDCLLLKTHQLNTYTRKFKRKYHTHTFPHINVQFRDIAITLRCKNTSYNYTQQHNNFQVIPQQSFMNFVNSFGNFALSLYTYLDLYLYTLQYKILW